MHKHTHILYKCTASRVFAAPSESYTKSIFGTQTRINPFTFRKRMHFITQSEIKYVKWCVRARASKKRYENINKNERFNAEKKPVCMLLMMQERKICSVYTPSIDAVCERHCSVCCRGHRFGFWHRLSLRWQQQQNPLPAGYAGRKSVPWKKSFHAGYRSELN